MILSQEPKRLIELAKLQFKEGWKYEAGFARMALVKVNESDDMEKAAENLTDIVYVKAFRSVN